MVELYNMFLGGNHNYFSTSWDFLAHVANKRRKEGVELWRCRGYYNGER